MNKLVLINENEGINVSYEMNNIVEIRHDKAKNFHNKDTLAGKETKPQDSRLMVFSRTETKFTFLPTG